ncbi:MAG: 30S ribosomal protein S6 [Candidatus Zixiibacteriota bacterium]|nr:MAG: 30S ribosomal protein S6 [candidate division Zixibacteria bacterium]
MGIYDTTFIVNPQTDDATIDREVQSVSDLITNNGGKIIHEDRIGTRRLAYPINKLTQGYYTTVIFKGPSQILPVLDRHFKLGEVFVRHLTILYEGDVKTFMEPEKAEAPAEEESKKHSVAAEVTTSTDDETVRMETKDESEPVKEEPSEVVEEKADVKPSKPTGYEEEEEL